MVDNVHGTEGYLPPECYDSTMTRDGGLLTRLTPAADIWSLAMCLVTMCSAPCGVPMMDSSGVTSARVLATLPPNILTPGMVTIIEQCLQRSPHLRPHINTLATIRI